MELVMLCIGIFIGAFAAYFAMRMKKNIAAKDAEILENKWQAANNTVVDLNTRLQELKRELFDKNTELFKTKEAFARLEERITAEKEYLQRERESLEKQKNMENEHFISLADKILEEKSKKIKETSNECIGALLKPLSSDLDKFKKQIEETYDKGAEQRNKLEERIKALVDKTSEVSTQANNLANALKGNAKRQGDWGEMILETVLERSGLTRGREYNIQVNIKANDSNMRPDALIYLPNERTVIVDSKVSLTAYDMYCNSDNSANQASALQEHLSSVKKHVDELANKHYEDIVPHAPDFTMMFIPIEPAYLLAMQNNPELWSYAYKKHVLLISPTNFIACLKLIADLWRHEAQSQNARRIAEQGAKLYDKFASFVSTFEDIGLSLEKSKKSYDKALLQLQNGRGNLISQAEKLKEMGIKTDKQLPNASE